MKIFVFTKRLAFAFLPRKYAIGLSNLSRAIMTVYLRLRFYRNRDLPIAVEIETDWRCNRHCWYCTRPDQGASMTVELYHKIIFDLKNWGFKGRISLHGYNEPLLDKRLCEFIRFVKVNLPKCPVVIYSNGDLLTKEMMSQLAGAGMDKIMVSIHQPTSDKDLLKLTQIAAEYPNMQLKDFRDGYRNFALWNRGSETLAKKIGEIKNSRCYFIYICAVSSNGNVVLCCQDGSKDNVMGNLNANSFRNWESSRFQNVRKQVSQGKHTLPICRNCGYQAVF